MDDALLSISGLHAYHGQAHVLTGVDLAIGREPLSLVGRNGMGKTTLCNTLMGLVPRAEGQVRFDGVEILGERPFRIANLGIGYVPQGRRIFPSLTVEEHLQMMAERRGKPGAGLPRERIHALFPGLLARRRVLAGALSGGEQQALAIARALMIGPRFLILDEISEGLAPLVVDQLVEALRSLSQEGMGMLIVEQRLAVAAALSRRLAIMVSGRIALETTSAAMMASAEDQQRYLGVKGDRGQSARRGR
ncbi:ABC transporter ATP-binding protein [Sorangium sp. So ce260]|uniref:ABC transporter ATP-binding protein n=1 Tax=Sorangium sp. So ce260 TaxID=3133291 RepID=UPI003F5E5264